MYLRVKWQIDNAHDQVDLIYLPISFCYHIPLYSVIVIFFFFLINPIIVIATYKQNLSLILQRPGIVKFKKPTHACMSTEPREAQASSNIQIAFVRFAHLLQLLHNPIF